MNYQQQLEAAMTMAAKAALGFADGMVPADAENRAQLVTQNAASTMTQGIAFTLLAARENDRETVSDGMGLGLVTALDQMGLESICAFYENLHRLAHAVNAGIISPDFTSPVGDVAQGGAC